MPPNWSYDSPTPALRASDVRADAWELENIHGLRSALARRLTILAGDLKMAAASDDIVEIIAQLNCIRPELEDMAMRMMP